MVGSTKRKHDTTTSEMDLRNVARKLFPHQSARGPRPSISGTEEKARAAHPPVKTTIKGTLHKASVPLRTVTNTNAGPASRPRPFASVPHPVVRPGIMAQPRDRLRTAVASKPAGRSVPGTQSRAQAAQGARQTSEQELCLLRTQLQKAATAKTQQEQQHAVELQDMRNSLAAKEVVIHEKEVILNQREMTITELTGQLHQCKARIGELEQLVAEGDRVRKKLHNAIQELKGNIRVFARVRGNSCDSSTFSFPDRVDSRAIELTAPSTTNYAGDEQNKTMSFTFDKVFEPNVPQGAVFEEIAQMVQSALDGYKVTVFAYGQTGSGKTYTMEGPPNATVETAGMIPRAVAQIFEESERLRPRGWEFQVEATFLEIYLEDIRDLLADPAVYEKRAGVTPNGVTTYERQCPRHDIHHGPEGTTVSNVTVVPVTQPSDIERLLQTARRNRSTAATKMNERSSRSHCVFTLRIHGHNQSTDQKSTGILNLIDLAGSERLNNSGVTGDRLKETQNINRSLSSLADVITALASKKAHVPYRNSKLTFLLQNCLGGDGKTLMFVNISPETQHLQESLCSLRFAAKVNACEIGTAKRRVQ